MSSCCQSLLVAAHVLSQGGHGCGQNSANRLSLITEQLVTIQQGEMP